MNIMSLYWICNQFGGVKKKWKTLYHNGVLFPPEYIPHNIPVIYEDQEIYLEPDAEEAATFYAKYLDTDYVKNPKFNKNFWADWALLLGPHHVIQSLESADFSRIRDYLAKVKEDKKLLSADEKADIKEDKAAVEDKYKYALVDGQEEPVGNFRIEPPGIFIGRGKHPKLGMIKRRIYPEDVTLNLSKDAPVPKANVQGEWGSVIHDPTVDWLASWKDDITGKTKYVWLAAHSGKRGESDRAKFDLARKLKKKINGIREQYILDMSSDDVKLRQIATAVYLIDTFALRVGNEKGADAADTVGVTSLRVEHIEFLDSDIIKLDFLGKDSIRYVNVATILSVAYQNLREFARGKQTDDNIFDLINSNDVNAYLQGFMNGLTAKVFRTFNASYTFSKQLRKITKKYMDYTGDDKTKLLLEEFNKANARIAAICNHQKKVSKSFSGQIEKMDQQIKKVKNQIKSKRITPARKEKLREKLRELKTKRKVKVETKGLSLGTSTSSYIDPRSTIAFIKKNNLPIDKLFTKAMQEKFKWAFDVSEDFIF